MAQHRQTLAVHANRNADSPGEHRAHVLQPSRVLHLRRPLRVLEDVGQRGIAEAEVLQLGEAVPHDVDGVDTKELDGHVLVLLPAFARSLVALRQVITTSGHLCVHNTAPRNESYHGVQHGAAISDECGFRSRCRGAATDEVEHSLVVCAGVSTNTHL